MPESEHVKLLEKKVDMLENDLKQVKCMIKNNKRPASLRGIARIKVSKKELDKEIKKAKKSLFKHASD